MTSVGPMFIMQVGSRMRGVEVEDRARVRLAASFNVDCVVRFFEKPAVSPRSEYEHRLVR